MRRIAFLCVMAAALGLVGGCIMPLVPPEPGEPPQPQQAVLELLSARGTIYRPLVSHGDDWYVEPYDRHDLFFATGRDRYGNAVGLSDDRVWRIVDVVIRCDLKGKDDTVYNAGDPFQRHGFSTDGIANACTWFPLYTGGVDAISGVPFAPHPLTGYAFNACANLGTTEYPAQEATITARATTDRIRVRITVPAFEGATYQLDLPGATPQESNVIDVWLGQAGDLDVLRMRGEVIDVYTLHVPVDLFWISGTWRIPVGATGRC